MTIRTLIECDRVGCATSSPVLGMTEITEDGLSARGWITERREQRSSLTGTTYTTARHFCSNDCLDKWVRDWVNSKRKEMARR
jgi:hypothetical protein